MAPAALILGASAPPSGATTQELDEFSVGITIHATVGEAAFRGKTDGPPAKEVEILTPDFKGAEDPLSVILEARPDIFSHNIETVPRQGYRFLVPVELAGDHPIRGAGGNVEYLVHLVWQGEHD